MNKNLRIRLLLILFILISAIFCAFPLEKRINLGLDLKGGMHLILKVDTEELSPQAKGDAVLRAIEILRNRIDGLGVGETVIQRQGENQILVQLPGITDRKAAISMIGRVAQLEFTLVNSDPNMLKNALSGDIPEGYLLKYTKDDDEPLLVEEKVALKGEAISDAMVNFSNTGMGLPKISLSFNAKGAREFGNITRNNVGERLAIMLDGEVYSAPTINEPILSGRAEINGQFDFDEASLLALALRSGSLPAPMHIEEERTIGPLLGQDSIHSGIQATILGGICVFIFMACYYLSAGIVADIALFFNLILIFGVMGFLKILLPESQVTLTLPGIAGIILTLGMAVDANVLINERIREEIENGRPLHAAITNGFGKALSAIIDSNITTLIAAFMLFQFGSGPIKGFAVTLTIGLLSSLFTAIFVTRTIFLSLIKVNIIKKLTMMNFFRNTKINFISKGKFCAFLSVVLIIVGLVKLKSVKDAAYGIDFAGGQIQEYQFKRPVNIESLRRALELQGLNTNNVVIQQFPKTPKQLLIRSKADTEQNVTKILKSKFADNPAEIIRIEKVGPVVGKALRRAATLAIILALTFILLYIAIRFKHFDFAVAGVIALLHDVFFTLAALMLTGRQIDLLVVTALLTIAGFSINDTIIIYDRVRENNAKFPKKSLFELVNLSINQTLGRTILTTVTTLMVVIVLYFMGGQVLNTFALCLIIGFTAGTYSTMFIVSPIVVALRKKW